MLISAAGRASSYPPSRPRWLRTSRSVRRSERMSTRNCGGMPCALARSSVLTSDALVDRGQLDHGPDGVLRLGRHPHAANSAIDLGANRTPVHHHQIPMTVAEGNRTTGAGLRSPMPTDPRGLRSDAPLLDAWLRFQEDPPTPFTIPGHKQRHDLVGDVVAGDVPLYAGLDTMKLSRGVLIDAEARAARLWGADLCRFSVGGVDSRQPGACTRRCRQRQRLGGRQPHAAPIHASRSGPRRPDPAVGPPRRGCGDRSPARRCAPRP